MNWRGYWKEGQLHIVDGIGEETQKNTNYTEHTKLHIVGEDIGILF